MDRTAGTDRAATLGGAGDGGRTARFEYDLPEDLIAQHPASRRDESRLMVLDRAEDRIEHRVFRDLAGMIPAGDALVLNDTRVFRARLIGRKPTGARGEVLLLHPADAGGDGRSEDEALPDRWEALVRPGSKLKPGRVLEVGEGLRIEIEDSTPDGGRIVRLDTPLPVREALERHGRIPLPPYVDREPGPADAERYQTVYARESGSVAAPTAGLHFTPGLLEGLRRKGVRIIRLTLHVGIGTFRPVEADDPDDHRMHAERYHVPAETAAALNETRAGGGSIWAVGTTVTRALETVADDDGTIRPGAGWTRLFIRPPHRVRGIDRLVTNFHLPRSTLLMLVSAFGGRERVLRAYREAVARRYRFYSYGDAMVIR